MNRLILFLLAASGLLHISICDAAPRQKAESLSVEDALSEHQFGQLMSIALSPAGERIAYTVQDNRKRESIDSGMYAHTGVPLWGVGTDIYVSNTETGETRNLTGDKGDNWLPVWSPDGHFLALLSNRDGSGQAKVWVWDSIKNELRKLSDAIVRGNEMEWTLDSQEVFITTLPEGLSVQEYVNKLSLGVAVDSASEVKAHDSTVVLYDGSIQGGNATLKSDPWGLDGYLRDLSRINIRSGKAITLVRRGRIASYSLSPDSSRVAYTVPKGFEKPGSQQILFDISVIGTADTQGHIVASDVRLDYDGAAFSWSPDGSRISFRTGGMEEKVFDCFVVDLREKNPQNVTNFSSRPSPHRKSSTPLWDLQGHIYFVRNGGLWRAAAEGEKAIEVARLRNRQVIELVSESEHLLWRPWKNDSTVVLTHDDAGKQDGFYRLNLATGDGTELLERGQCYTCVNSDNRFVVTKDGGRIVYFAEDASHDNDLWMSEPSFRNPLRLTHLNSQFDKYQMGSARVLGWLSDDGESLHGTLLLPSGYEEGKRYPLIVWVYGGESLSNNYDHFGAAGSGPFNMQLLATRGYAVLLPDAPQHIGTPMLDLAKTVLPGVNKTIEMGIVDPDRIGVIGHSYGGYSALSLIVQTKRFKAAIDIDGMGDLLGAYGAMDKNGTAFGTSITEQGQGLMGGTPWEFLNRYVENSPTFFLYGVETPLLVVHGSADSTVPPFLADEVFVELRRLGKEVEYAKYEGEGHSPPYWNYVNQVDFCNRMIGWFDVHLKAQIN